MLTDFHNHQIALGNSCKQIRKSGNPQILHAITDQYRFIRKKQHQILWETDTGNEKCNRHQTTKPQCHTENIIQRFDIAPAPVLCPENRQSSGCSRKKHILDKLNLRGKRNCRHVILVHPSEHKRICHGNQCQHQVLQHHRKHKTPEFFIKNCIVCKHKILSFFLCHFISIHLLYCLFHH